MSLPVAHALPPPAGRGYTNIEETEDCAAPTGSPGRPKAWAVSLLAGTAATVAAAAWLTVDHRSRFRAAASKSGTVMLQEAAGTIQEGVEFNVDGGWYQSMDHIPSAELCSVLCQGEPQCDLFTWVKDAGLEGCPSQCWLKSGPLKYSAPKPGVTSGYPPPKRDLPAIEGPAGGPNTLYCWVLSAPEGNEVEMLNWQYEKKVGPFQCDKAQMYSNQAVEIGGMTAHVIESDMKCEYGGDSQSALNTWIFIAAWKVVLEDGDYRSYEWTVKVDADAVFFPNRLKAVLANHVGESYISNCQYGLHGPIEVFSRGALDILAADYQTAFDKKTPASCVNGLEFGEYGEDMFIDQCLSKILQVPAPKVDPLLICEDHCDCPDYFKCPANDPYRVSFHPMKSIGAYENCMASALNGPVAS